MVDRAGVASGSDSSTGTLAEGLAPRPDTSFSSKSVSSPPGAGGGSLMVTALLSQKALGVDGGHAARARGRDRLAVNVVGHVAAREHARHLGRCRTRLGLE